MGTYIILSEQQAAWIQNTQLKMIDVTERYGSFRKPLRDEEFEYLASFFSDCTRKSRNNKIIIDSSLAFLSYLDENHARSLRDQGAYLSGGKLGHEYPKLNQEQMQLLRESVMEMAKIGLAYQNIPLTSEQSEGVMVRFDCYCWQFPGQRLLTDLAGAWKGYFFYCQEQIAARQNESGLICMDPGRGRRSGRSR